jgi:uncharacterized protein YcaQ
MKTLMTAAVAVVAAAPAFASNITLPPSTQVPEINAYAGVAAVAVLAAVVALIWERRRAA